MQQIQQTDATVKKCWTYDEMLCLQVSGLTLKVQRAESRTSNPPFKDLNPSF